MIFKASFDNMTKALTVAITLLFAGVIAGNIALFRSGEHLISLITIVLILSVYFSACLFRITQYEVSSDALIIHRPLKNKIIPLSDIARGRMIEKGELKWTIRTFGNGGLFGYTGHFANRKLGAMQWYATRRNDAVLLQTNEGKKILLTPDEPEAFLQALQR